MGCPAVKAWSTAPGATLTSVTSPDGPRRRRGTSVPSGMGVWAGKRQLLGCFEERGDGVEELLRELLPLPSGGIVDREVAHGGDCRDQAPASCV